MARQLARFGGRFLSEDHHVFDGSGANRNCYCNNILNYNGPTGLVLWAACRFLPVKHCLTLFLFFACDRRKTPP